MYGFFLSHGEWDIVILPFGRKKDRDDAVDRVLNWGLKPKDAYDTAALISAYVESWYTPYRDAAYDIVSEYEVNCALFDQYVDVVEEDIGRT